MTVKLIVAVALGTFTYPAIGAPVRADHQPAAPARLRCEYQTDPTGLETMHPRLGWVVASGRRAERQTAYRLVVSSSRDRVLRSSGDLWDSGRVVSSESVLIPYAGRPLTSGAECWWRVQLWDRDGSRSAWSPPARWTMGLLKSGDWAPARWIGEAKRAPGYSAGGLQWIWFPEGKPNIVAPAGTRYFRRLFSLPTGRALRAARAEITCDNGYELYVNGRSVGRGGEWHKPVPHDITALLASGENIVAIAAINEGSAAGLTGQLTLRFDDGSAQSIPLDPSWKVSNHDSPGWQTAAFDDRAWPTAMALGPMGMGPWGVVRWDEGARVFVLPPSPLLRKTFRAARPVRRATLYASALGCYEMHLNGARVGRDYFNPGWQEYRRRVYYNAYDVTPLIRQGANAIGAVLSDGWYSGYIWAGRDTYGTAPRLRAQLRLEYADGARQTVVTDESWRIAYGPILEGDVQQGETYDARKEIAGWDTARFNDAAWGRVSTSLQPAVQMGVSPCPPVRRQQELRPARVTEPRRGVFVFNFGQNVAGWARIRARGPRGTKIVLRHSGMLNPDGTIYTDYLREARAIDAYIMKGGREEVWEPTTTYHGFQYVEVTGYPGRPSADDVTAVVCHSDLPVAGAFSCSDPRVNKLYSNLLWTLRDNLVDLPTGCADRAERLGWCDHNLLFRTECYTVGMAPMIAKWMVDVMDSQSLSANGSFLQCAPIWGDQESPGWSDVGITGVYYAYRFYGDTQIIRRHYASMARYIEHIRSDLVGFLRPFPYKFPDGRTFTGYGDWLSIVFDMKHNEVLNNLFNGRTVGMMAEMARAVGRAADATKYTELHSRMKEAFNAAYVSADGELRDRTQAQYAMALDYGYLPAEKRRMAVAHLAKDILENSHQQTFADALGKGPVIPPGHLTTGFHGSRALLPALSANGRNDVAYRLLLQDTYPSWLYLVKIGATSIWERWDSWVPEKGFQDPRMNSFNMPNIGASIGEWLFSCVGGIETDGVGFRRILIRPYPGDGLTHAAAAYESIRGPIRVRWDRAAGAFNLAVTIPANTRATISLPVPATGPVVVREGRCTVWSGGAYRAGAQGISGGRRQDDRVELTVGSGAYRFVVTPTVR